MYRFHLLTVCLVFAAVGCKSAPPVKTSEPDVSATIPVVRAAFDEALVSAAGAQRQAVFEAGRTFVMRYNQASCECPPFEVYLEGKWRRYYLQNVVEVDGSQAALDNLREEAQREADASQWPLYQVRGRLTTDSRASENDIEYGIVAMTDARVIGVMSPSSALSLGFETELSPPEPKQDPPPEENPPPEEKDDAGEEEELDEASGEAAEDGAEEGGDKDEEGIEEASPSPEEAVEGEGVEDPP